MTEEHIPVFEPYIDDDTLAHVKKAFDKVWLGMGNFTQEFEHLIGDFLGLDPGRKVIACNTGTSALHLALKAAGVGPNDEVIVPSFNYVADHQAIHYCGAKVVFCDIDEITLGIDCNKAEELITKNTKAILPLHFAGIPCNIQGVHQLARQHNLRVVEDGMHGFGTEIGTKKLGSFGDITCFSFDPVKIITSIDGGCVIVNSDQELEYIRQMRFLGVDKETQARYKNERSWEYDVVCEGYRYHMNNIAAAIGLSQIKQISDFIRSRQMVCNRYSKAFAPLKDVITLRNNYDDISPFIYSFRVNPNRRLALIEHLKSKNIATGIHFLPVHEHQQFKDSTQGNLDVTNKITQEVITLPLHSHMKDESIERIIHEVVQFFGE